jgi:hypothetical protein
MPHSAAAKFLYATRNVSNELGGADLVEAIGQANKAMLASIRSKGKGKVVSDSVAKADIKMKRELAEMYAQWVKERWGKSEDSDLVRAKYLHHPMQS